MVLGEFDVKTAIPFGRYKLLEFSLAGWKKVTVDNDGLVTPDEHSDPVVLDTWFLSPGMRLEVTVTTDGVTVTVHRTP